MKRDWKRHNVSWIRFVSIALSVFVLDLLTKILVLQWMPVNTAKAIIPGLFNLVHVRNTGAAFSLLAGAGTVWRRVGFSAVSVLALGVILFLYTNTRKHDNWTKWGLALIFGGALGNLADRLRFGEVVDFLDFYLGSQHWPAFNLADSAITIGACMLVLALFQQK
jgi:signal peptidase II